MKKLLVILGSTATGKTDLGLELAKKYNGELVSCDSRQVYKGLDIGTGKLPNQKVKIKRQKGKWEIDGVSVWMYDAVEADIQFTVKDYLEQARKVVTDITGRGKLPIVVGGTGLYLKALLEGIPNLAVPVDNKLREQLQKLPLVKLQQKLQEISPARWSNLNNSDRQNPRRLLRSIELVSMYPYVRTNQKSKIKKLKFDVLKIGLILPRQVLNKKIDDRLISRLQAGMIEEAQKLQKKNLSLKRMKELGLEYGALADFLSGKGERDEMINNLKHKIHQYAKRQMTWFKKEPNVFWIDKTVPNWLPQVEKIVDRWYYATDE